MWDAGNFAAVAEKILEAGELVVERAGVEPGMDVLDVACGTGNATLPAVRAGARATGLDFAPGLLAIARERAADAMVEIDFVEGDAQELPFGDASFDRVVSTFGHMFVPDHRRTADEMRRVLRPGGAIAVACWTPEGSMGRMSQTIAEVVPPPPGGDPPLLWGSEEHVRELWGPDVQFERHAIEWKRSAMRSCSGAASPPSSGIASARTSLPGSIFASTAGMPWTATAPGPNGSTTRPAAASACCVVANHACSSAVTSTTTGVSSRCVCTARAAWPARSRS